MAVASNVLVRHAAELASEEALPWRKLHDSTIVVTGSTGLIGSAFVRAIAAANDMLGCGIKVVLPVRNPVKASMMFGERDDIDICAWQLGDSLPEFGGIDYFVHAACGTSSKEFSEHPASTIMQIVAGGEHTLTSAAHEGSSKYVFLSTMEVYGEVRGVASETNLGSLDPMEVRNSYPEAKRLVECLCASYWRESDVPTVVLRLAQTFGQGVERNDARVFAEFGRDAVAGQDIVLLSDGQKKNPYLSVDDAVRALLFSLVYGLPGEAYNAANEDTYCSILDMASMVIREFGASGSKVRREFDAKRETTFRKSSNLELSSTKLRGLGWTPHDSLKDAYDAMIECWKAR